MSLHDHLARFCVRAGLAACPSLAVEAAPAAPPAGKAQLKLDLKPETLDLTVAPRVIEIRRAAEVLASSSVFGGLDLALVEGRIVGTLQLAS